MNYHSCYVNYISGVRSVAILSMYQGWSHPKGRIPINSCHLFFCYWNGHIILLSEHAWVHTKWIEKLETDIQEVHDFIYALKARLNALMHTRKSWKTLQIRLLAFTQALVEVWQEWHLIQWIRHKLHWCKQRKCKPILCPSKVRKHGFPMLCCWGPNWVA